MSDLVRLELNRRGIHHKLGFRRADIDEVNDNIYHSLKISYRVKDDPENEIITIRAFEIAHRRLVDTRLEASEPVQGGVELCGGLRVDKFEVWLDKSPVVQRIASVAKTLEK